MSFWSAIDRLVDRAPELADIRSHRLQLFAARRWRTLGRPVPAELAREERAAAIAALTAPILLERARAAYDGTMVLMKGYEVAARYPDVAFRPFGDLDLLVSDSRAAQRALLAAGFQEVGDPELFIDIHHERPVWLPGLPLAIELHRRPKWPEGLSPPPTEELFADAVPSSSGVEGVLALPRAQHAVVLAAHSWAHLPLRRILDLVDVAAASDGLDRGELRALASRWRVERVWKTTIACVDALLYEDSPTWAQRVWARNLAAVRERTVFESHVEKWFSSFWGMPFAKALREMGSTVFSEFRPAEGEGWREKRARSRRAARNAFVRRSEHDRQLGPEAHKRGGRRR